MSTLTRFFLSWRIFFRTFTPPEKMAPGRRNETRDLILKLSKLYGFKPSFSSKQNLDRKNIELIKPRVRGVYRLYSVGELVYIGASCDEVRGRLLDHYREAFERPDRKPSKLSVQLHENETLFDWLFTAFPGWVEEYFLLEHELKTGSIPRGNSNKRSNLRLNCPY